MWVVRPITGPPLADNTIQGATTDSIADFFWFSSENFFLPNFVLLFSSPGIKRFTMIWEKDKGPRYLWALGHSCLCFSPCICHCPCLFFLYYTFHDLSPKFRTFANIFRSLLQKKRFWACFHQSGGGRGSNALKGWYIKLQLCPVSPSLHPITKR